MVAWATIVSEAAMATTIFGPGPVEIHLTVDSVGIPCLEEPGLTSCVEVLGSIASTVAMATIS